MRAPHAYVFKKTIIVLTYGYYPKYVTPDDKMITIMLHLPLDKSKLHSKKSVWSTKKNTIEYKMYDILDQICKDNDLHLYAKQ